MEEKIASLNIDESIIKDIVTKRLQTEIAQALMTPQDFVNNIVSLALRQKVDRSGRVSGYSSDNRYDFLDIVTKNAIQKQAKETLDEWLNKNKEKLKQAVLRELNAPSRKKSIAKAYLNAIEHSLTCSFRMSCDVKFEEVID